ncbi:MAG: efflux transporter outer membrane subunit [Stellaceae bacterium]
MTRILCLLTALLALAACTVGPDYHRPSAPEPAAYKEAKGWKPATPRRAGAGGAWWSVYRDPALDQLEHKVAISNQNLKAAAAAYRQAEALVDEARSNLYPTLAGSGSAQRGGSLAQGKPVNQFSMTGAASWTPDIWGKIRRSIESQEATAQASAADLAAAQLSAEASLATDYFTLRATDEQKRLLDAAVHAYAESLRITQNQYHAGTAPLSSVLTARTQLEQTRAQAINTGVARAQLEHAIAVLAGEPPSALSIKVVAPMSNRVPVMPTGLPSALLERRPDIAAAERQMAAANAEIGVAIGAYYPDITLSASLGLAATALTNLFNASNALWAVGGAISDTVFDAGLRAAEVRAARAGYDEAVANYRETVLTAFQQVEDDLASLRILAREATAQSQTVRDARQAERLTMNQYLAGTVAYTSVVVAQTTALSNEEAALTILQNRLTASVALISALGGGWNAADLPPAPAITSAPNHKSFLGSLFE